MSALGWKLRRLQAMSAGEILHRASAAARDRLAPPGWARADAATAARHLLNGVDRSAATAAAWRKVANVPARERCPGTLAAADRLAGGHWTLFGREVALGDPPDWNIDPASGTRWPDGPTSQIDYRRTDLAGGAKSVWEAGRLTLLPTLALAARVSGNREHAERARRWLADFVRRNPLGRGIHHASGIEMAIRVVTIGWTLALLDGAADDPEARAARGFMAQQALWCRDHRSLGSSANNHLLAEYAAMVVAGAGLGTLAGGERLMAAGLEGLVEQVDRQIHPDGVTAEQAFRYLPFVWELLLPALALAGARGWQAPEPLRARLAASLEFARAVRRADGTLPPIGDEDDARILLADEAGTRLDLAGNALAAWLGTEGLGEPQALAVLLTGRTAAPRAAADGERRFVSGGCTVWRAGASFATLDHGPLGLGSLAAHGHADALALTLRHGADDLFGDPGTLAYHEDAAARDWCRGTPAHSTVSFGGRSQSEMLGPFLWGRRATVMPEGNGWQCRWWSGEVHTRAVRFAPGDWTVEDQAVGPAPEIGFALPPGAAVELDGMRAVVTNGRAGARFEGEGLADWRVEPGSWAEGFARGVPAPRLVAAFRAPRALTRVRFGPR